MHAGSNVVSVTCVKIHRKCVEKRVRLDTVVTVDDQTLGTQSIRLQDIHQAPEMSSIWVEVLSVSKHFSFIFRRNVFI